MTALLISRLICLFALLFGTMVFGCLPLYVQEKLRCNCDGNACRPNCRAQRGKKIVAFLIFFGGGVLLGTTFLHLLPEAREGFERDDGNNTNSSRNEVDDGEEHEKFSMPEFIVCCGFFGVYLFEEILHHFLGGNHSHVPCERSTINNTPTKDYGSCPQNRDGLAGIPSATSGIQHPTTSDATVPLLGDDPGVLVVRTMSIGAVLTFAALSFHSFFEGFAVGLRPDAKSTYIVFAAIAVHKFVLAFVVGLEYLADCRRGSRHHLFVYVSIFALMSPIGIAIAMVTETNVEDESPLTISVLNAIATGTLLYVTFFEILAYKNQDISSWVKWVATATGFVVLGLIQYGSTFA